tara:strand:+ start:153 stop:1046 length:894 start_codon:yes stop_codon:yes gene_type:complete
MKFLIFLIFIILSGCAPQSLIINQGQHGFPGELSQEHNIYQLEKVKAENKSYFGFTRLNNHNDANIINFFGSSNRNVGISNVYKNIISAFNILSFSFIGSQLLISEESDVNLLGAFVGVLCGGILNEITFNNRTKINASLIASRKLIEENPDVDLFFYPKYNISSKQYLLHSKSKISLSSKGAVLKKEIVRNTEKYNGENFFKRHRDYELMNVLPQNYTPLTNKINSNLTQKKNNNSDRIALQNLICSCSKILENPSLFESKSDITEKCQILFKNMRVNTENGKKQFLETVKKFDCK